MSLVLSDNKRPTIEHLGTDLFLAALKVDFDSSYASGGEPFSIRKLTGIVNPDHVIIPPQGGYLFRYDKATELLRVFWPTNMADLTLTGTAITTRAVTVKDDDTAATLGTLVKARMLGGLRAVLESQNAGGADSSFSHAGGRVPVRVPRCNTTVIQVEDLAAGADIAARSEMTAPLSGATILKAGIVLKAASAGVDAGNATTVALKDKAGNTIVTKTYDDAPVPPAAGIYDDLGAIDATHGILTANEVVEIVITQGATADFPAFIIVVEWEEQEALFNVYFDEDAATVDERFLINNTVTSQDLFVECTDGTFIRLNHSDTASADGVQCYFDDDGVTATEKLVFVSPTNANGAGITDDTFEPIGRVAAGAITGETDGVGVEVTAATDLSALVNVPIIVIGTK